MQNSLISSIREEVTFHVPFSPHDGRFLVRFIGPAGILAAGGAIDESEMLSHTLTVIYDTTRSLLISLYNLYPFKSLSIQRKRVDKSIGCDVNFNRDKFERHFINDIARIPGTSYLADPRTKSDSPVFDALSLIMEYGHRSHSLRRAENLFCHR